MSEPVKAETNIEERKVEKLVHPLMPDAFRHAEHEVQRWLVYAKPDAEKKHLEDPKYWTNVAYMLRVPAELVIWAEDGTWKKWATVHACDRNWAKITIDAEFDYGKQKAKVEDPDMRVEWAGPMHKWRVVRTDGEVLSKDHQTKELAGEWLRNHRLALEK